MNHYYENIHGWFDSFYSYWYRNCVKNSPVNAHFVEIGSFKGKSSSYMAVEIVNSNKKIKFDCIDSWADSWHGANSIVKFNGDQIFEEFKQNMSLVKDKLNFNYHRELSIKAAELYEDRSLDLVFIDASHNYDNVKNDINAWLPKIKPNGLISGHDWHLSEVKKAVTETLGNVDSIITIWFKTIK